MKMNTNTNPNTRTAASTAATVLDAVREVRAAIGDTSTGLVVYFATSHLEPAELAAHMEAAFSPAAVIGCTTAGELISGRMLTDSLVVMALPAQVVPRVWVQVVERLADGDAGVDRALGGFEAAVGRPMLDLDLDLYVGLVLVDGLSGAEEALMDHLGDRADIQFIGGSAGDDANFARTHVFANGRAYSGAAVLALLHVPHGFETIKTQSFTVLPTCLTATAVDEARREVLAFDGQPAATAYAAALGVAAAALPRQFMRNPLGLMAGGDPFVRSPQQVNGDSVRFYCGVREGMSLNVLESGNIVDDTRAALAPLVARPDGVAGVLSFDCILRTLELREKQQTAEYGSLFASVPAIGFATYGEQLVGHINQTSTMLVLHA